MGNTQYRIWIDLATNNNHNERICAHGISNESGREISYCSNGLREIYDDIVRSPLITIDKMRLDRNIVLKTEPVRQSWNRGPDAFWIDAFEIYEKKTFLWTNSVEFRTLRKYGRRPAARSYCLSRDHRDWNSKGCYPEIILKPDGTAAGHGRPVPRPAPTPRPTHIVDRWEFNWIGNFGRRLQKHQGRLHRIDGEGPGLLPKHVQGHASRGVRVGSAGPAAGENHVEDVGNGGVATHLVAPVPAEEERATVLASGNSSAPGKPIKETDTQLLVSIGHHHKDKGEDPILNK